MKRCPNCHERFESADWRCLSCGWQPLQQDGHTLLVEHEQGISGYKGEYFAPLAAVEAGNFWFEARNRVIIHALRRCFPHMRSFLEIGCGTGFVLQAVRAAFPQAAISGAEYYAQGLRFAQSRVPDAAFYQLDARTMPFEAEFDVIGAFDVIEHIKEDEQVLAQMFQAVKPGGGIALTVPQHHWLWSVADEYKQHERRYERGDLMAKVERAGFKVAYTTSFVSLLLPAMYASRFMQNKAEERPDRMTEFNIGGTANTLFNTVMQAETALIGRGLRFRLGGSRLMIAQKAGHA